METPLVVILCLGLIVCFLFGLQAGMRFEESLWNLMVFGFCTLITGLVTFASMTEVHIDLAFAIFVVSAFLCTFFLGICVRVGFGYVANAFDEES